MGVVDEILRMELARARDGLKDLQAEYAALADPSAVALDDEHDSEGSTVGFERARVAGLLDRARRLITELEAAVRRVDDGSYGYCESCGSQIGAERLGALPSTRQCIECVTARREARGP